MTDAAAVEEAGPPSSGNDVEEDLTSDGEAEGKDETGNDVWVEVFLVAEK